MNWNTILAPALTALALAVAGAVVALARAAYAWLRTRVQNDTARALMDRVAAVVATEVAAAQQGVVPKILAVASDGRISAAEAASLRDLVVHKVELTLGKAGLAALDAATGQRPVGSYLASLVEAQVLALKRAAPPPAPPPALDPAQGEVLPATRPPEAP